MRDYIKAVLRELTEEQRSSIRKTDKEYVFFKISVFNAGAAISLVFTDHIPNLLDGGHSDFVLETSDAINCLELLNL